MPQNALLVEVLLGKNPSIEAQDSSGRTALYRAAMEGKTDAARLLLDRKANPNAQASDGSTPLLAAVTYGHTPVVQLLRERGAKVNHADAGGTHQQTALNDSAITGEWYGIMRDADYAPAGNQFFFKLKAHGGKLFGSVTRVYDLHLDETHGYRNGISDGKVEGNKISFWYVGGSKAQDAEGHLTELKDLFYGVVSGDAIHFTFQVEGGTPIEFTAKRIAGATSGAGANPK